MPSYCEAASKAVILHASMTADGIGAAMQIFADKSEQLRAGYKAGRAAAAGPLSPKGLLFAGMGGSGATSLLIKDACTRVIDVPFTIVQHYQIPNHVRPGWHTLAFSYSGNTEETLSVAKASLARGVPITAFASGGELADLAPVLVPQAPGFYPRMAIGHAWFSALGYLEASGILNEPVPVERAVAAVEAVTERCGPGAPQDNEARVLARQLVDKIPQIYATPAFAGTANYMRCMINENAKKIASVELVPECNHNDLMGWAGDPKRSEFAAVALSHAGQNPQMAKRLQFMAKWYQSQGVPWHHHEFAPVTSFSDHVVAQAEAIQFADYVSVYLAELRGVDPMEIRAIEALKDHLGS